HVSGVIAAFLSIRPEYVGEAEADRKSTRLNSSHRCISYAVFCLKKKTTDLCSTHRCVPPAGLRVNRAHGLASAVCCSRLCVGSLTRASLSCFFCFFFFF